MKLYYDIKDKPKFGQMLIYALQQLLAIMAATLVVPIIVGNGMQPTAALFGAGIGTLIYVLFTKAKSPVFLGSSFAFLGSMSAAFAGAVSAQAGYAGIILGAFFAGLFFKSLELCCNIEMLPHNRFAVVSNITGNQHKINIIVFSALIKEFINDETAFVFHCGTSVSVAENWVFGVPFKSFLVGLVVKVRCNCIRKVCSVIRCTY